MIAYFPPLNFGYQGTPSTNYINITLLLVIFITMWSKSFQGPKEVDKILKSEGRDKRWPRPRGGVPEHTHAIVPLALLFLE